MKIRALSSPGFDKLDLSEQKDEIIKWLLNELVERYNYPIEWLEERSVVKNTTDFSGFILYTNDGYPYLIASIAERGSIDDATTNLNRFFNNEKVRGIGIISDGTLENTKVIIRKTLSNQIEYLTDIESFQSKNKRDTIYKLSRNNSNGQHKIQQLLTNDVESLFFEAHSFIRDIDGLHMDEALDELSKIIYCKYHDEANTPESKPFKLQRALYNTNEELAANIRGFYNKIKISNNQLDKHNNIFDTELKLSSSALTKVVEIFQKYNLSKSEVDIKGRAFQNVLLPTVRAGMGQYFTPQEIIRFMVDIVQPSENEIILDPFCGSGHFLTTSYHYVQKLKSKENENKLKDYASSNLFGIEKSDRMVRIATTDQMLQNNQNINLYHNDSLLDFRNYSSLEPSSFDIVLTNPPFGSVLGEESYNQIGDFEMTKGVKNVPLEVLGLERSMQFLRPGGKLGIVIPDGILANNNAQYVRNWILKNAKVRAIISLPIETFSPFGANIKTSVILLRKRDINEVIEEDYKIFLAHLKNIGYDSSGRKKTGSELESVKDELIKFFSEEGW